MSEVWRDLMEPGNALAHLSFGLLIIAMLMTSLRSLRVFALLAGLAAFAFLVIGGPDSSILFWVITFVLANGCQLALMLYRSRRGYMRTEEVELMENVLEVQEPAHQRRLLDVIEWRDVGVGEVLMKQGQAKPPLIYIASGAAAIRHNDELVGVCGAGDFLGEMSMITGERASADVEVTNTVRIARFNRDALAQLAEALPELSRAFDRALNRGLAAKVLRMNQAQATASKE